MNKRGRPSAQKGGKKMVNRIDPTNGNVNRTTRHETQTFSSHPLHLRENPRIDDLIVSLSNAHENRRARQVNEWERRQHSVRLAP